jgi:hypothetical protein
LTLGWDWSAAVKGQRPKVGMERRVHLMEASLWAALLPMHLGVGRGARGRDGFRRGQAGHRQLTTATGSRWGHGAGAERQRWARVAAGSSATGGALTCSVD